ncbi:MAG: hypothetical protein IPJ19_02235 [Planctomycetes bacterium]|nr:hypothetical protein [Planctomycetota bacterium]
MTSRVVAGLRSLRSGAELGLVRTALCRSNSERFQIVHHSIQSNHLHLIVEAHDRGALTTGLRGLFIRLARALNQFWRRRGSVFAERFHERELRTPREVRHALLYVLQNARKHGVWVRGADPCSSGAQFDGWAEPNSAQSSAPRARIARTEHSQRTQADERTQRTQRTQGEERAERNVREVGNIGNVLHRGPSPAAAAGLEHGAKRRAWTWLLDLGWRRHGLLHEHEVPRGVFGAIAHGR